MKNTRRLTLLILATLLAGCGQLIVSVQPELEEPFHATVVGVPASIERGTAFSASVTTDLATEADRSATVAWYLGSEQLPETGRSVTLGADLYVGSYTLDVVVTSGSVLAHAGATFDVVVSSPAPEATAGR